MIYNFITIPIEIDTSSPEIHRHLENLFGAFRKDFHGKSKVRYMVNPENGKPGEKGIFYKIYRNGHNVSQCDNEEEFLLRLEQMILDDVMEHLPHLFFIHAAVLANNRGSVILPGPSGSGKSTLAMALAERNFYYLSDETAPIEKKTHKVYPFPRGIKLRADALKLFSLSKKNQKKDIQRNYFNIIHHNTEKLGTISKVNYILFPSYEPASKPSLKSVSKAMAISVLAACSVNFYTYRGDSLSFLAELVDSTICYNINTNDLEETCSIIENLIG